MKKKESSVLSERTDNRIGEAGIFPPVVAIGASAGGLEAIKQLLGAIPADTGMAFVVIQHLPPVHDSALAELLTRATSMPVSLVTDGMEMEGNHVYVIPPDTDMAILNARLQLMPRCGNGSRHLPVDYFFRTLAEDQGTRAIGVILSGAGSDGAVGIKMIKCEGGITFAQHEESARYDGMPHAAISTGCVDFVLSPVAIAVELSRLSRHPYVASIAGDVFPGKPETLNKIFILLRDHSSVDFTHYKQPTIRRRINRRMLLHNLDRLEDYLTYLQSDKIELAALYQELLIHVTDFFRESDGFDALKSSVIAGLIDERLPEQPIRVWVPGCSTGEEAYSVAICILECLENSGENISVQIFATDVDNSVIGKARMGIYPESISLNVSSERLHRFFNKVRDGYQIRKNIRDVCIFARQDVTRDPPFSRLDLISCHNLLIYLQPELQKKVLQIFHYALKPTGCLMLGSSESIGGHAELFTLINKKNRMYRNKLTGNRPSLSLRSIFHPVAGEDQKEEIVHSQAGIDIQQQIDSFIASKYGPAGVVINETMDVLRFFGDTGDYLIHGPGKASLNLLKLVRKDLIIEVHRVVTNAIKLDSQQVKSGIRIKVDDSILFVDIEALPVKSRTVRELCYLVLFRERAPGDVLQRERAQVDAGESGMSWRIRELEQELAASREYMRSVIEEQENIVQELQIANEEAQSSNEELRSTNEELETATEEVQVTNEELQTVNDELMERSQLLKQLNSDYENLLRSVEMPIIMLDKDLLIRSLTPAAKQSLALSGKDIGRSVQYLESIFNTSGLAWLVHEVMMTRSAKRTDVQANNGRWYSLQLTPYVSEEEDVSGAVLALTDISERKAVELQLARLAAIVESSDDAIIGKTLEGTITDWNQGAEKLYGYTARDAVGRNISMLAGEGSTNEFDEITERINKGESITHCEGVRIAKDGGVRVVSLTISPILDAMGRLSGISTIAHDISERKEADRALKEQEAKYRHLFEQTHEAIFVHDLEGNIVDINNRALCLFGYTRDELLSVNVSALHPPHAAMLSRDAFDMIAADSHVDFEIDFRKKDGKLFTGEVSSSLIELSGDKVVQGVVRDISKRKAAESALRCYAQMASSSRDMMALLDTNFVYLAANDAYVRAFGKTRDEILGHTVSDIFGDNFFQKAIKPKADRCFDREEVRHWEWIEFPAAGRQYMEVVYFPYIGEDNEVKGFIVNARQVTPDEKERADALKNMEETSDG